jgi:hypothetical protein
VDNTSTARASGAKSGGELQCNLGLGEVSDAELRVVYGGDRESILQSAPRGGGRGGVSPSNFSCLERNCFVLIAGTHDRSS